MHGNNGYVGNANFKKCDCIGPGGRKCSCCYPPPGKEARRSKKRARKEYMRKLDESEAED